MFKALSAYYSLVYTLLHAVHRNTEDETPLHCAAYNDRDSGELMKFVMKSCAEIVTDDEQEIKFSLEEVLASRSGAKMKVSKLQFNVCMYWLSW